MANPPNNNSDRGLTVSRGKGEVVIIQLQGDWSLGTKMPDVDWQKAILKPVPPARIVYVMGGLSKWDSSLLAFLLAVEEFCEPLKIQTGRETLPKDILRLLDMATAVPKRADAQREAKKKNWLTRLGHVVLNVSEEAYKFLEFVGEMTLTMLAFITARARFRRSDVMLAIQQSGASALAIVTLISFLVGLIMAYVGATQLKKFGADIYVANLVGMAMLREMGAMMTAIIMAGRTGAAFAAQIGSMKVTEEIDALRTVGLSPMEFLVLPRLLALSLMMPLLTIYANFIGIAGGYVASMGMLDITSTQFINQTIVAVTPIDFATGLIKSVAFGIIVAGCGCMRGMQCGSTSSSVGDAATSAVVLSITLIIVADAAFTVLFNILGI